MQRVGGFLAFFERSAGVAAGGVCVEAMICAISGGHREPHRSKAGFFSESFTVRKKWSRESDLNRQPPD